MNSPKDFPKQPKAMAGKSRLRPRRSMHALESRIVFDGAAVAAVDALAQANADAAIQPDATAPVASARSEIVFVESNVADYQTLLNGVNPGAEVHVLDASQDGLAQMAGILGGRSGIDAIHIISHGAEGSVQLGALNLSARNLGDHAADLSAIGGALDANADILLYGCSVAAGSDGAALVDALAQATQADVAASTDITGAAAKGGDWVLEYATGAVDVAALHDDSYQHTLVNATYDDFTAATISAAALQNTATSAAVSGEQLQIASTDSQLGLSIDAGYNVQISSISGTGASLSTGGDFFTLESKLTFSVVGGKTFDLSSIMVADTFGTVPDTASTTFTLNFTGYKGVVSQGSTSITLTRFSSTPDLVAQTYTVAAPDASKFQQITSFTITATDAKQTFGANTFVIAFDNVALLNITAPDTTAPTISAVSIPNSAMKVGSAVTVSITAGEAGLSLVSGTVNGVAVTGFTDTGSGNYTATYTVVEGNTDRAAGATIPVSFTLADAAGNNSTAYTTAISQNADSIDANTPSAPSAPNLDAASDTGSSNTDDLTNDTTPDFSGTAESGATVTLYDGATVIGTGTATGGNWTITSSALSAGAHTITAKATDAAGNVGVASSGLAIAIDTTAPTTTVATKAFSADTGASSTDFITKTAAQTISGTLSAATVTGEIVEVSLNNGSTWTTAANTVGQDTWSLTGQNLTASNILQVRVSDAAGNIGTASTQAYTLDTVAPAITFSALAFSADTGTSGTDFLTNTTAQTIGATLSGAPAGTDIVYGSLDNGATWTNITSKVSGTTLSWDGVTLSASSTLMLKVTDAAGNDGTVASQTYTLDATAPAAPSTPNLDAASDTGSSNADDLTNDTTPTFTGTAESGATVTLYDTNGSTSLGSATADGSGNWTITSSALSAGTHTVTAKATDAAGNTSVASSGLAVVIDTAAPTGLGLSATTIATLSATSTSTIATLSATDGQAITYSLATGNGTNDANNGSFTITGTSLKVGGSALTAGTYNIYVAATDAAGNVANQAFTLTVVDAPSVSSVLRPSGASSTVAGAATLIAYTVTFSESVTGVDVSDFALTATGTATGSIASVTGSGTTYTVTVNTLGGDGTLRLDLNNSGTGIQNGSSVAIASGYTSGSTYTLDHTAPNAPSTPNLDAASDTGSSNADDVTSDTTPDFSGTAAANSTVTLYDTDGSTSLGSATADGSGNWTITASTLTAGSHTVTAKATDAAGNVSAASAGLAITIDAAAPNAPSTPDMTTGTDSGTSGTDNTTSNTTPTFIGTAEANSTVTLYDTDGFTSLGSATANGSGNWSITSSALGAGAHTLTAKATDAAGNVSVASSGLAITIDTTAPTTTVATKTFSADTGTSADFVTNTTSQTISGTLSANVASGEIVEVSLDNGATWTTATTTVGQSTWSLAGQTLTASNTLKVRVTDAAGNNGTVASQAYTLDTTAPSIANVSIPNAAMKVGDTVTATLTVADDGGVVYTLGSSTIGGFALSNLTRTNSTTYTAQFTVTENGTDVAAGSNIPASLVLTDTADNSNTAYTTAISQAGDAINAHTPTDIALSNASVMTTAGSNAAVGNLSSTDGSTGDTFTYSLVAGAGSTDNASFNISGNSLRATTPSGLADGNYSVRVRTADAGGNFFDKAFTITVSSNVAPVVTGATAGQTLNDTATVAPFSGVTLTDAENNNVSVTVTLDTAAKGVLTTLGGFTDNNNGSYTLASTTLAAANTALQGLVFNPADNRVAPGSTETTTFTISVNDGTATTTNNTTTVISTSVNDAPVVGGATAVTNINDTATATPFSAFTISDADSAQTQTLTVTLDNAAKGALSNLGTGAYNAATGVYTFTGTAAQAQAAIRALVFTPTANRVNPTLTETTTFTVSVSDGIATAATNNATTVVSTSVNDAPVVGGATAVTNINDTATATPFSAFTISDADSAQTQTLTVTLDAAAKGALSNLSGGAYDAATGVYTYTGTAAQAQAAIRALVFTPTANRVNPTLTETTTFTVSVSDGTAAAATNATTTVVSTSVNDVPVVGGATAVTNINDTATATPFSAFTVADSDTAQTQTLTVTLDNAAKGALSNLGTGAYNAATGVYTYTGTAAQAQAAIRALVFTPAANRANPTLTETTTFTVSVSDGIAAAATNNTTTVVSTSVNDAPTLSTPTAASYTDTAAQDTYTANTGTLAGADVDTGTTLTYGITGGTVNAGVSTLAGTYGSLSVNTTTGAYTYTPNATAINALTGNTTDTFTVSVSDGAASSTATYTVNLTAANDTPVLATPTAASYTDTAAQDTFTADTGTLAGTDRDTGAALTYGITGGTVNAGVSTLAGTYGSLSVNTATGAYTYTPNATAINALTANTTDTFTVSVSDGALSSTATYTVNLTAANDTPVLSTPTAASYTDTAAQDSFTADTGTLGGTDRDTGAALTYGITGGTVNAGVSTLAGTYGSLSVNTATGAYTYTPNATAINALTGNTTDTFTVSVSDGTASSTATYTVNLTAANDTPALATPTAAAYTDTAAQDSYTNDTGTLTASDRDTGTTLTYGITGGTVSAGVSTLAGTYGSLSVNTTTGAYTYTPNATAINALTANTTDTFTVSVSDGALSSMATYTVNLTAANDTPVLSTPTAASYTDTAAQDTFTTDTGTLAGTDRDTGTTFTYGITGGTVNAGVSTLAGTYGSLSVNTATGAYTYTPNATAINALTANTTDTFTVSVSDGTASTTATYTVNLTAANDTPVLATPTAASYTDTAALDTFSNSAGTLAGTDRDTGAALTYGIAGGTVNAGVSTLAGTYGSLSVNIATGAYTYTPNATAINALTANTTDTFTVSVSDGALSSTATYTVNLSAANDAPVLATPTAASYTDTAAQDTYTANTGTLAGADVDTGTTLTYGITGGTENAGVSTLAGTYGSLSVNTATGAYTYTPNATAINGLTANTTDTFTVSVSDGTASTTATYTVNLTAANDTPVLATPTAASYTDTAALDTFSNSAGTLAGTDRDTGAALTYGIAGGTVNAGVSTLAGTYGSLSVNTATGAYTYTPNATAINALTANTTDTFTVSVSDGALSTTATYTVNLTAANDTPVLATPTAASYTDTAAQDSFTADTGMLAGADRDTGAVLTYGITGGTVNAGISTLAGAYGSLSVNTATGAYTYTPNATVINALTANTTDSFTVNVSDGALSSTATYTVSLTAANDTTVLGGATAVTAINDTATATPFSAFTLTDADTAQSLTLTVTLDTAAKGVLTNLGGGTYDAATGVYTYTGTAAQAQAAIRALVFTPAVNRVASTLTETTTFTVSVNDGIAAAASDATTTVVSTAVNDAPVLLANGIVLTTTNEDTASAGVTVAAMLSASGYSDADSAALQGMALTSLAGRGSWQYSLDGTTWSNCGAVSNTAALLLDATTLIRYNPGSQGAEQVGIGFVAWDRTSGSASVNGMPQTIDTTVRGGNAAFSATAVQASLDVTAVPRPLPPAPPPAPPAPPPAPPAPPPAPPAPPAPTPPIVAPVVAPPPPPAPPAPPISVLPVPDLPRGTIPQSTLAVDNGIANVSVGAGEAFTYVIPKDAFASSSQDARLSFQATQANGAPLPNWVRFNSETGTFSGEIPKGVTGDLRIRVKAVDEKGNEAVTTFTIKSGVVARENGEPGENGEQPGENGERRENNERQRRGAVSGQGLLSVLGIQGFAPDAMTDMPVEQQADSGEAAAAEQAGAESHAPQLSAQLQREAQRFGQARETTLRHLAAVEQARELA